MVCVRGCAYVVVRIRLCDSPGTDLGYICICLINVAGTPYLPSYASAYDSYNSCANALTCFAAKVISYFLKPTIQSVGTGHSDFFPNNLYIKIRLQFISNWSF